MSISSSAPDKSLITGLLLAGGRGTRMGETDKGLQSLHGEALALHVLQRLTAQTATVMISANQNIDVYKEFGFPVWPDHMQGFAGPLAGIQTGLLHCQTPYLLCVPCDSPFLPPDLAERLLSALMQRDADLAVAVTLEKRDGIQQKQNHPVFALMKTSVLAGLTTYLEDGGRKMQAWHASLQTCEVMFSDNTAFRNINTLEELRKIEN
ncbi:molybdenum cofactor guanylyltransferase MobA [Undibacterium pigrum]|uniref:Molybdenum cofactor guanylyltransferase n=1 Tax=Undibacterium pigrum TaxID=401470 RepID=A0A318JFP1_9BURK|nr:molybdenum cofactor guanylyltransferase [Undibacterium pigrum]